MGDGRRHTAGGMACRAGAWDRRRPDLTHRPTHGAEAGHRATHRVSGSTETKTYGKSATVG